MTQVEEGEEYESEEPLGDETAAASEPAAEDLDESALQPLETLVVNEVEALQTFMEKGIDPSVVSPEQIEVLETAGEQLAEAFLSLKEIHQQIAKKQKHRG